MLKRFYQKMNLKFFFKIGGGFIFLVLSFLILSNELKEIQVSELLILLHKFSKIKLFFALLFVVLSYLLMGAYEHLAVSYAGKKLSFKKVLLPSTISHGIANVSGFPLVSGAPFRYRFYSLLDFRHNEIAKIIYFVAISNGIGLVFLLGFFILGFHTSSPQFHFLSFPLRIGLGFFFLSLVFLYIRRSFFDNNHFHIFSFKIDSLNFKMALKQLLFSILDWLIIPLVFFVLLPGEISVSLFSFFTVFFIAQSIGSLSQVPGGIGTFDTSILLLLKALGVSSSSVLIALLLFRFVYYILPFVFAIILLIITETTHHFNKTLKNTL